MYTYTSTKQLAIMYKVLLCMTNIGLEYIYTKCDGFMRRKRKLITKFPKCFCFEVFFFLPHSLIEKYKWTEFVTVFPKIVHHFLTFAKNSNTKVIKRLSVPWEFCLLKLLANCRYSNKSIPGSNSGLPPLMQGILLLQFQPVNIHPIQLVSHQIQRDSWKRKSQSEQFPDYKT